MSDPSSTADARDAAAPVAQRWLVPASADLRWRCWHEHTLVYHPPSGDTHLLNPLAAEVLRSLSRRAATAAELADHVAAAFDLQVDGQLLRQMEQCLAQFAELGLINPAHVHQGPVNE